MKQDQIDYYIGLFNGYLDGNLEQAKQLEIKREVHADAFLKDMLEQYVQVRANIRVAGEDIMRNRFLNAFDPIVEEKKSYKKLIIILSVLLVLAVIAAVCFALFK